MPIEKVNKEHAAANIKKTKQICSLWSSADNLVQKANTFTGCRRDER